MCAERRRVARRRLALLGGAVAVAAAGIALAVWLGARDRMRKIPAPSDVILVVVDTERADYTTPYGCPLPTTPFLAQLAREGVTFTHMTSSAPWTLPAMYSLMTGLYPTQHGMTHGHEGDTAQPVLPDEAVTLAELLQAKGFETFGVNTNAVLGKRFGFGQGFDEFVGDDFAFMPFPKLALTSLSADIRAADRYFLWLHFFDPHHPYYAQAPWFDEWNKSKFRTYTELITDAVLRLYRKRLGLGPNDPPDPADLQRMDRVIRVLSSKLFLPFVFRAFFKLAPSLDEDYRKFLSAAYMSDIRFTDQSMAESLALLPIDDDALVIVTADHGEELFERNGLGHHTGSLHEELVHVPLVVRLPGKALAGTVIDAPVSTIDILPTILDLVGATPPAGLPGRSLARLLRGGKLEPRPQVSEVSDFTGDLRSITEYPWKLIYDLKKNKGALYNLERDPGETRDIAAEQPERAAELGRHLRQWLQIAKPRWPDAPPVELTPAERRRLQQMGYLRQQ